jgi:NADH:ubiquinone oxidoreductase subunit 5 (subunit L)/multisubunit Na+/H+ antiporter MnhA subunit
MGEVMSTLDYAPLLILGISFVWILAQTAIAFLGLKVTEKFIKVNTALYCVTLVILNLFVFADVVFKGHSYLIHLPDLLSIRNYTLTAEFYVDIYGALFALLSAFLFGIISKFSFSYLHREEGFFRYFLLISLLSLGLQFISYAGSLDILFIGWELVGITSVHLIAFFQYNIRSAQNSLRTLVFYRICDISLLVACILLHFYDHGTEFHVIQHHATEALTHWVGLFIIIATLAKSAQFPLSNWLFRAMEGPTTSSAIYYGALSVHLGPFLLLRTESLWSIWPGLRITIFVIGLTSCIYASLVGKTRSDVKSSIAYTTITQVGIIYMELALGLNHLAIVHILCHALLRTWQFLRSSSVIHDFLESATTREQFQLIMYYPEYPVPRWKKNLYIHAMNGFYLDQIQNFFFVIPFKRLSQFFKKY